MTAFCGCRLAAQKKLVLPVSEKVDDACTNDRKDVDDSDKLQLDTYPQEPQETILEPSPATLEKGFEGWSNGRLGAAQQEWMYHSFYEEDDPEPPPLPEVRPQAEKLHGHSTVTHSDTDCEHTLGAHVFKGDG